MSEHTGELVSVKIIPNDKGSPPGKLADAEVIFEADAGPLSGLKLVGFSVWERRDGGRNVTFPARQFSVNGERRSFALLRKSTPEQRLGQAQRVSLDLVRRAAPDAEEAVAIRVVRVPLDLDQPPILHRDQHAAVRRMAVHRAHRMDDARLG